MCSPFFIIGASRSGTTLLRLMLNAHSHLAIPGEMKYFQSIDCDVSLSSWRDVGPETNYRALVRDYLEKRRALFPVAADTLEEMILADSERTLRAPYRLLLAYWASHLGKPRWGEKTPSNLFSVDILRDMFPDARFINVVRDPRAVVQSMNAIDYYSNETVFNALNWRKSIRTGEQLFRDCLSPEQLLTIRYEDLVSKPEPTLTSICGFLDEPFEPVMLQFYKTSEQFMPNPIRTPSIRKPVNQDSLTKWVTKLSSSDVALIETICATEMNHLGYERRSPSSSWLPITALPKTAYWHWKAWQHRDVRGYEVGYPFLNGLSARFPLLSGSR
jgi:hypothetical protein